MARSNSRRARNVAAHVRTAAALERGMRLDLTKVLRKAIGAAARRIGDGHHHDGVEAAASTVLAYEPKMAARLAQSALAGGRLTLDTVRESKRGMSPYEAAVAKWAKQHAASKIVEISKTTRKQINRVLTAGVKKGATNAAIAKDIREILGGKSAARRAERIARTETHTASQVGSEAAARSTGIDMVGEWAAVEDARTRPAHAAADGQIIELGATFTVGGEQLRYPGDPNGSAGNIINCRCVALWRPRRDGE